MAVSPVSGRLDESLLLRVTEYAGRILTLAEQLERTKRPQRVISQLIGSGTSPGANLFEAHEAMSRADFVKSVAWASKELSETRFWLLLFIEKKWLSQEILAPLLDETHQLLLITKAIVARSRRRPAGLPIT